MGRIYEFVCNIDFCYTSISQKFCPARNLTKTCPRGSAHNIAEHFWVRGRFLKKNVCPGTSRKPSPGGPRIVSQGLFGSRGALSGSIWDILMVWVSHGDSYSFAGITILCISVLRL